MRREHAVIATTHVDRDMDRIELSSLEDLVNQINSSILPVGIEHDPRIPPIGRIVSANIRKLDDGEYAAEAEIEFFEPGDSLELSEGSREIPIDTKSADHLHISYDKNLSDPEDQILIGEISGLLGTTPSEDLKKSVDPITVIVIAGTFVAGAIATGFLQEIGKDSYALFKDRLKTLMKRRKPGEKERLLNFRSVVSIGDYRVEGNVILTNPTDAEIDGFFEGGIKELDRFLSDYGESNKEMKKLVFEYSDGHVKAKFAVRKDGVPFHLRIGRKG